MMWNNGTSCFGGGLPMMGGGITMILIWGFIIFLIFYAVHKSNVNKISNESSAVDVLKKRYSMGEISTEEYRERLLELMKKM
ncbi:hypothetical protein K0H71_05035 [Bacillus sp. IITD106]|nr:hypothetical protein [Bacillus sp. IITD106]